MIEKTPEGWWIVSGDTHIGRWIRDSGRLDHDQFMLPALYKYVRPGDIVLDVGANVGDHTIAYSDWVGPGLVIAFECGEDASECLKRNTENKQNVRRVKMALYSHNGHIAYTPDPQNIGASYVKLGDTNGIPCRTLDSYKLPDLDFIKIDAEGAELNILSGSKNTIEKFLPIMCLEVNPFAMERNGWKAEDLFKMLSDFGYSWTPLQPKINEGEQYDIICLPKKVLELHE